VSEKPPLEAPRYEGALRLAGGRRLGYAEYGPVGGRALVWFHGTPGARRQVAPEARALAHEHDVRLIAVERPGIGESTPHIYPRLVDFPADIEQLADALGIERFAVAGLSGGGPYTLACGHELPERVTAAAVLGGVAPTVGPDAARGGASGMIRSFAPFMHRARQPVGGALRALVRVLRPLEEQAMDLFASQMPPGDQRVFADPAIRRMFLEDIQLGARRNMQALCLDVIMFGRPWGFALGDIRVPVHLWYGDADVIVPVHHGEHLAKRIPGATLRIRPDEGHLGGLGASREMFEVLLAHWP
jgi:pimeloyl-ACP methyl ester carboxylesterase